MTGVLNRAGIPHQVGILYLGQRTINCEEFSFSS